MYYIVHTIYVDRNKLFRFATLLSIFQEHISGHYFIFCVDISVQIKLNLNLDRHSS